MLPSRLHISKRATDHLKLLKSRTGVTPNILCRIALSLSLEEKFSPDIEATDTLGLEFNISTLLGDASSVYEALIINQHGVVTPRISQLILSAHIDNGIEKIKRCKNVIDLFSFYMPKLEA